jgi:hypothetical protein
LIRWAAVAVAIAIVAQPYITAAEYSETASARKEARNLTPSFKVGGGRHRPGPHRFWQRIPALHDQRQVGRFSDQKRQAGRQVFRAVFGSPR